MTLTRLNNSSLGAVTSAGLPAGTITSSNISANMPTGSVLQVLHASTNATLSTNSTSFVSSGLSQAITPSSTSNKILCVVSVGSWYVAANEAWITIYKGNAALSGTGTYGIMHQNAAAMYAPSTGQILDSPNTTSAQTYTVYYRTSLGDLCYISHVSYGYLSLTLMEIAG